MFLFLLWVHDTLLFHVHDHSEKDKNLLRFLVFEPLFIGGGYCKKSFPFVTANTLTCLIVRGMIMILGDDKRSYMCFLVIFLDAFVRDRWRGRDSSYVWKRWWPYLGTLASSTLMQFFITCWMLMRFSFSDNVYNFTYKE